MPSSKPMITSQLTEKPIILRCKYVALGKVFAVIALIFSLFPTPSASLWVSRSVADIVPPQNWSICIFVKLIYRVFRFDGLEMSVHTWSHSHTHARTHTHSPVQWEILKARQAHTHRGNQTDTNAPAHSNDMQIVCAFQWHAYICVCVCVLVYASLCLPSPKSPHKSPISISAESYWAAASQTVRHSTRQNGKPNAGKGETDRQTGIVRERIMHPFKDEL